ncbi:MAG: hypothetical protein QXP36_08660 [Conexivisphaerales archaeon]
MEISERMRYVRRTQRGWKLFRGRRVRDIYLSPDDGLIQDGTKEILVSICTEEKEGAIALYKEGETERAIIFKPVEEEQKRKILVLYLEKPEDQEKPGMIFLRIQGAGGEGEI